MDASGADPEHTPRSASAGSLLHRAARAERRRSLAWLLAGAVTVAGTYAVGVADVAPIFAGVMGACFVIWSLRQVLGVVLAHRDLAKAATPPRRAHVVLLNDPNPRAVRPLLAVWPSPPPVGARLPKPECVWRCDDELDELRTGVGSVVVHEAWLDTGPRSWSKPRWVVADAGIALPHRRSLLARWYVSMSLRRERPDEPQPLTIDYAHVVAQGGEELPLDGSLLRSVAGRIAFLAALTALVLVLS